MSGLGSLHVGVISRSDHEAEPDAVATVFMYGPRGALKGTEIIGRECALSALDDLVRALVKAGEGTSNLVQRVDQISRAALV